MWEWGLSEVALAFSIARLCLRLYLVKALLSFASFLQMNIVFLVQDGITYCFVLGCLFPVCPVASFLFSYNLVKSKWFCLQAVIEFESLGQLTEHPCGFSLWLRAMLWSMSGLLSIMWL